MVSRVSDYLGITNEQLESKNVFDGFVGIDTLLFLDPYLLKGTKIPEFTGSRTRIVKYFESINTLISVSKTENDRPWVEAVKRLTFKETPGVYMGYGSNSTQGKAVGHELAYKLATSAKDIISFGIIEPEIFELLGLFEDDFGADRLSDMTISILHEDFYNFTDRICKELGVKTSKYTNGINTWNLPSSPSRKKPPIILIPREFLRDLPLAQTWEQIDYVVRLNRELRNRINKLIGKTWSKSLKKKEIKKVIFSSPETIKELIKTYKTSDRKLYDYKVDPASQILWSEIAKDFSTRYPIKIENPSKKTKEELMKIVHQIIEQFKLLMEANGLNELIYIKKNKYIIKSRHERFVQKLFYAIADSYCKANDIDLTREPNGGRGSVDFKFSQGYFTKVVVEIKLTSNSNVYSGYMKQLPTYQAAERAEDGIYLIVRNTNNLAQIKEINSVIASSKTEMPECIIIDARIKPSASKLK